MPVHREKDVRRASRKEVSKPSGERPIINQANPRREKVNQPVKKRELTYLKDAGQVKRTETQRSRTRTRTLSPTEVKILNKLKEPEEPEQEYEDDFEDYESDFEEDSSQDEELSKIEDKEGEKEEKEEEGEEETEVEKELKEIEKEVKEVKKEEKEVEKQEPEMRASGPGVKREIEEIKLAMKRENDMIKSRSKTPEIPVEKPKINTTPEFSVLRKRTEAEERARRRGRDLLGMITLDTISYSFLDVPPIPYETYMKMFARSDMKQVHVQTNEDDLSEETQTETIEKCNKWVQKPPDVEGPKKYRLTREERLGVGGEDVIEPEPSIPVIDTTRLNDFLQRASDILLPVLGNNIKIDKQSNSSERMYFSDGFVSFNTSDISFLKEKSVTDIFSSESNLLSVHSGPGFGESIICCWNINDQSRPVKVLKAENRITSVCCGLQALVLGGLKDGTVCLWDLKESCNFHESPVHSDWVIRSPTYLTTGHGHSSTVVSVRVFKTSDESRMEFTPGQVCTLEEEGTIIIWSIVQGRTTDDDLGLAHWGKIKLVKSSMFSCFGKEVPGYVRCNDLALVQSGDVEMYVANNVGDVLHVSKYGTPMKPKAYKASDLGEATCLEMCQFDPNYFLAGCKDGGIRLCSRNQEQPLISLNGAPTEDGRQGSIVSLAWLFVRPFVFFALDSLSRIHVWNLGLSDMYPEATLNLPKKQITCLKLMQLKKANGIPHIVLGTKDGKIEIHRLNEEFGKRAQGDIQKDIKKFLKYVSIL